MVPSMVCFSLLLFIDHVTLESDQSNFCAALQTQVRFLLCSSDFPPEAAMTMMDYSGLIPGRHPQLL